MSLVDVIERVGAHRPQPFLAPIIRPGRVTVRTIQEGIVYSFPVRAPRNGWYMHDPASGQTDPMDTMSPVREYLCALESFMTIALYRITDGEWLVIPWNNDDAAQRRWTVEPSLMYITWQSVRPLDVVVVRRVGGNMIFDGIDQAHGLTRVSSALRDMPEGSAAWPSGATPELRRAQAIVWGRLQSLRQQARQQAIDDARQCEGAEIEENIKGQLEFMGAELSAWHDIGDNIEVRYVYQGTEFRHIVTRSLQVQAAGLCLSGTDRLHNLSAIVSTMGEAVRQRRFDIEGALA